MANKIPHSVYIWVNGNVMVFDAEGQQIRDLQGAWAEKRAAIEAVATPDTVWHGREEPLTWPSAPRGSNGELDVEAIIAAARPGRERIAIRLMGELGMRADEARHVRVNDLDPEALPPPLAAEIAALGFAPDDAILGWSGRTLSVLVRAAGDRAGIPIRLPDLRAEWLRRQITGLRKARKETHHDHPRATGGI